MLLLEGWLFFLLFGWFLKSWIHFEIRIFNADLAEPVLPAEDARAKVVGIN